MSYSGHENAPHYRIPGKHFCMLDASEWVDLMENLIDQGVEGWCIYVTATPESPVDVIQVIFEIPDDQLHKLPVDPDPYLGTAESGHAIYRLHPKIFRSFLRLDEISSQKKLHHAVIIGLDTWEKANPRTT